VGSSFDRSWLHDQDLLREDLLVGGRWRPGGTGCRIEVTDPATGAVIGQVAEAGEADVRDAIAAAQQAFPGWAGLTAQQRGRILGRTWRVAKALEFGVVGVNTGLISYEGAPLGA
jgi:acyl-CoA reductase-like NAD-dependent aldehyde dehydrogenase